jgi:uncharacterized Ntn-hydrolase superfamily protein
VTWSVLAVDGSTGETAIAVASCVPIETVLAVPGFAPGRGALVTQSYLLDGERERGLELLGQGRSPEQVLAALVDPAYDPDFELRQLAIVDLDGRVAQRTGHDALAYAGDGVVRRGAIAVAVQGNILTGPEVVAAALDAARLDGPCDLPARVLAALEAGGRDGRGDARCVPLGRSSQAATLQSGAFRIDVGVDEPGAGEDPLVTLRARFDEARVEHPCPTREGAGGSGGSSSRGGVSGEGDGGDGGATQASGGAASPGDEGCAVAKREAPAMSPALVAIAAVAIAFVWRGLSRLRRRRPRPGRSARCRSRR